MDASKRLILLLAVLVVAAVGLALWFSRPSGPGGSGPVPEEPGAGGADRPSPRAETGRPPPRPRLPPRPPARGPGVRGVVTGAEGEPVEGARVLLLRGRPPAPAVDLAEDEERVRDVVADLFQYYPDETGPLHPLGTEPRWAVEPEEPLQETVTGAGGRFAFRKAPFARFRLSARKGDLASPEVAVMPEREEKEVTLVLREAARVKGWVRSADDHRMLAGAVVRVLQGGRSATAVADSGGSYEIRGLPAGPVMMFASHPEYAGDLKRAVLLAAGEETEVDFDLTRGHRLTVVVRGLDDEPDEEEPPLEGATVAVVRLEDHAYAVARTGPDGSAVFEGLPKGTYLVNARREEYLPAGEDRVPLQGDRKWELLLEKAVYTTVLVVDDRDVPVRGAELWTANLEEEFEQRISRKVGTTDANGEFRFPFDWDGKEAALHVVKEGFGMGIAYPDDPSDGGVIKVRLEPGVRLRGRVTDRAGNPVEGATVYLEVTPEDLEKEDLYATLYTDAKGEYRFPWLPPGDVVIEVDKDGYDGDDRDLEVRPGQRGEIVGNFMLERQ